MIYLKRLVGILPNFQLRCSLAQRWSIKFWGNKIKSRMLSDSLRGIFSPVYWMCGQILVKFNTVITHYQVHITLMTFSRSWLKDQDHTQHFLKVHFSDRGTPTNNSSSCMLCEQCMHVSSSVWSHWKHHSSWWVPADWIGKILCRISIISASLAVTLWYMKDLCHGPDYRWEMFWSFVCSIIDFRLLFARFYQSRILFRFCQIVGRLKKQ